MNTTAKKALSVQDISCFGQCSNTVVFPLLSAAGLETVMLPTALLSTHTGGFKNFTFLDLTEEMEKILAHFEALGLTFDYKAFISFVGVKIGTEQILDKELYSAFFQGQIRRSFALIDIFPRRNWMRLTLF